MGGKAIIEDKLTRNKIIGGIRIKRGRRRIQEGSKVGSLEANKLAQMDDT